jgi:hypothetical protein
MFAINSEVSNGYLTALSVEIEHPEQWALEDIVEAARAELRLLCSLIGVGTTAEPGLGNALVSPTTAEGKSIGLGFANVHARVGIIRGLNAKSTFAIQRMWLSWKNSATCCLTRVAKSSKVIFRDSGGEWRLPMLCTIRENRCRNVDWQHPVATAPGSETHSALRCAVAFPRPQRRICARQFHVNRPPLTIVLPVQRAIRQGVLMAQLLGDGCEGVAQGLATGSSDVAPAAFFREVSQDGCSHNVSRRTFVGHIHPVNCGPRLQGMIERFVGTGPAKVLPAI